MNKVLQDAIESATKIQHIAWRIAWLREEENKLHREYEQKIDRIEKEIATLQKAISNSNCTSTAR